MSSNGNGNGRGSGSGSPMRSVFAHNTAIQHLTEGSLAALEPQVQPIIARLLEMHQSQDALLATVKQQKESLESLHEINTVAVTFNKIALYQTKLAGIRKDMLLITDKVSKAKKRAEKLRARVEADEVKLAMVKEKERDRDRALLAQPSQELRSKGTDPPTKDSQ